MKPPITAKQKKILVRLLALSPDPREAFDYDELTGYLFGIAITPDIILPSEWVAPIFGEEQPLYDAQAQLQEGFGCLMEVYNTFIDASHAGTLRFPFNIMALKPAEYDAVFSWVSGLSVALSLRPDIWELEESPELPEDMAYALMSSLMIIDGLLDPEISAAYFDTLPADILREAFGDTAANEEELASRQLTILLASLPMAVEALQEFSRFMDNRRIAGMSRKSNLIPLHQPKTGSGAPGCCDSHQKQCCRRTEDRPPAKKGQVIRGRFPGTAKKSPAPGTVFQFKVSLVGARPQIWRRIQVPGTASLADLHAIIQICMGWNDCHLHHFDIDDELYAVPSEEEHWQEIRRHDERSVTLESLGARLQPSFLYVYDMGDYWEHQIELEKKIPPTEDACRPKLVTGRRACPPEDCGGISSYLEQVKILKKPNHPAYEATQSWFGPDFRPDAFDFDDIRKINEQLQRRF